MLTFTEAETALIQQHSVPGGWDRLETKPLTKKIKDYLHATGVGFCCYCRVSMDGWHKLAIDPEHVLPKGKHPEFMFAPRNISLSCKRCNMRIKKEDDSFYTGTPAQRHDYCTDHYRFIHPNLDNYEQHILRKSEQLGVKSLVKFVIMNDSAKGKATYNYFELQELEHDTFDEGQGLKVVTPSPDLPAKVVAQLLEVLQAPL